MMSAHAIAVLAYLLGETIPSAPSHSSDSLLLAIIGVAFLLLAALARGLSELTDGSSDDAVEYPSKREPDRARIQIVPVQVESRPAPAEAARPLLSVDVEDYFQTEAFSKIAPRADWDRYPLRVAGNTRRLLDLFDRYETRATFFIVGWVARRVPKLVREISARGHELGCHSYWHRTVYSLSPEEFRQDTLDAVHAIEDAAGIHVHGYRAPTWSITRKSLWAIHVLAEEGFAYDSSIYPIHHDLYGIPGAMDRPHVWKRNGHHIIEIPPATLALGKVRLPAAGGGYLRIFPLSYSCLAIDQITRRNLLPVIYLHPWEIDPDQPRLQGTWKSRTRQYWGLQSFQPKLEQLLERYRFVPFRERWGEIVENAPDITGAAPEMAVAS
jgi:polysaccharide deacetylase family protein (PEP-CTERM system associated)